MTISLKITVSGDYEATIKHKIDGADADTYKVNGKTGPKNAYGSVEGSVHFQHGSVNEYEVTEAHIEANATPATSPGSSSSSD